MDALHTLNALGLTEKESRTYVALLQFGTRPTSFIATKAGLNRGTTYLALHSLLEKGLILKTTKRKVQYFSALNPEQLVQYLDRQSQEMQRRKESAQAIMGQLAALVNPLTTKPKMEFFDGREGARTVLNYTLEATEKTLFAYLSLIDVINLIGDDFFADYTKRRIARGYSLHVIRTLEKDRAAFALSDAAKSFVTSPREKREVRYTSEDLAFPMTMYLFDDKVALLSSRQENFALLMESREFSTMQKKLFQILWRSIGPEF